MGQLSPPSPSNNQSLVAVRTPPGAESGKHTHPPSGKCLHGDCFGGKIFTPAGLPPEWNAKLATMRGSN